MRLKILLLFICLSVCVPVLAQSKKAGKHYAKALQYKAAKKPDKACKRMAKSISKDPKSPEAYSELGEWYFDAHKFAQAAEVFKNASARCQNGALQFAKPYARTLIFSGNADKALTIINTYAIMRDSAEWNKMRSQALFIKEHGAQVCPAPVAMNARINSLYPELFPSMAVDTAALFFTRRVNNENDDYFTVSKDTCSEWYNVRNLGYPANSPDQELAQCISPDGHYLFITRCDNRSENGWAEGGCDIFMAYRVANDSDWTIPQPFGFTINTPEFEGMPSVSPDTRELYFVSNRKGGFGGYDIYVSRFESGLWQPPVNAGPGVNTAGNETAPYVNLDNKTLFFTSDGHAGFGGTDLFMSRRKADGSPWQAAENMGYPINTAHDEKSSCMAIDGKKLYFASDRNGPAGNYDIFEAYMPYTMRPDPVSYITGYVYDSLDKEKLTSASMYICTRRGDTLYEFKSNRGNASFIITLPLYNTYIIHTAYMGHLEVNDTITFDKQYTQEPMIHNIAMLPSNWEEIRAISDTLIATVHFDANVTDLSPLDKGILKDAMGPWLQHTNYTITVNAYTDNSGNPMLNEELSARRANIIAKELIDMNIEGIAILSKGWGEANTIASNDTEEGRRTNRRVEIRIRR